MAGIWERDNKVLPGVYTNIRTNEPLSIEVGERGVVVILQELSTGTDLAIYKLTSTEDTFLQGMTKEDKKLALEALKKAREVYVLKLKSSHTVQDLNKALDKLKTFKFDVLCYPFGSGKDSNKEAVKTFVKSMRDVEGVKVQAVLANYLGDSEAIINVVQSVVLKDGTKLKAEEVTAYVAGLCAGASITTSNTNKAYEGAIDVEPRMTKTQLEEAVSQGKFVFKVDGMQNVTVAYDINFLTTFTEAKSKIFAKNRIVRTLDNIANDISKIFEASYIGKIDNNVEGRNILKGALVDYFKTLQNMSAIRDFDAKDVEIKQGTNIDSVLVDAQIKPVDSVEKIYLTVNLS